VTTNSGTCEKKNTVPSVIIILFSLVLYSMASFKRGQFNSLFSAITTTTTCCTRCEWRHSISFRLYSTRHIDAKVDFAKRVVATSSSVLMQMKRISLKFANKSSPKNSKLPFMTRNFSLPNSYGSRLVVKISSPNRDTRRNFKLFFMSIPLDMRKNSSLFRNRNRVQSKSRLEAQAACS
jgi:hypothetical protein